MTDLTELYVRNQIDKAFLDLLEKMADFQANAVDLTSSLTVRVAELQRARDVDLLVAQTRGLIEQLKGGEEAR